MKFPITVQSFAFKGDLGFIKKPLLRDGDELCGAWVAIRPCDEKLGDKTFLGVYLGELAMNAGATFNGTNGELTFVVSQHGNPAIYVPDLKRIVMGYESWWGLITSPEQLKQITDADIQNVWYVRALQELSTKQPTQAP